MKTFLLALLLALPAAARLDAAPDAGLPGEYLNYAGLRALGMGRAYTALAEGPEAIFWNPAGLGFQRPNTIAMNHARTMEDFSLSSVFYAQPVFQAGALALGYVKQDSGSMALTDELNRSLGSYSDVQQTFAAAYGLQIIGRRSSRKLMQKLSLGAAVKYSDQQIYSSKAGAWGLDAGLLARFKGGLSAGLRIQNLVQPELKFETASDKFPRRITAGIAASFLKDKLVLSADASRAQGQKNRYNLGAELEPRSKVRLRAGYDLENRETILGLACAFGRSEAAYSADLADAGMTSNFGFSYEFGGFPVAVSASPDVFSPIGLKKYTTFSVKVKPDLRVFSWTLYIRDQNGNVARSFTGNSQPPPELTWDGSTQGNSLVAAGSYIYTFEITNSEGRKEMTPPQTVRVVFGTPMDRLYESGSK